MREIDGGQSVRALATYLRSRERRKPVVVVSVAAAATSPYIDASEIVRDVGELADVYLIHTGNDTWTFSNHMPDLTHVYGGAGRVYPVGTEWATDPYRSPLRFAFGAAHGGSATRALVADALRMASEAGLTAPRQLRSTHRRSGVVRGIPAADRALVRLETGAFATIVQELTMPRVALDRVVATGMPVTGLHDEVSGRLDIRAEFLPAEQVLRHYEVGDVVLAQVEHVKAGEARLLLHPEVAVTVRRDEVTSNDLDELTSLMTHGEVLTARVVATGPDWRLSLIDVEDDEVPRPAVSLLAGGPPWLEAHDELGPADAAPRTTGDVPAAVATPLPPPAPTPTAVPEQPEPTAAPAQPAPPATPRPTPAHLGRHGRDTPPPARNKPAAALQSLSLALDEAKAARRIAEQERDRLAAQVAALQGERTLAASRIDALSRQLEHTEQQLQRAKASRRKAARRPARDSEEAQNGPSFPDPEEQFRFEVHLAWARRIPSGEKAARPLGRYEIGPQFLDSVDAINGISRDKIVDVVVELATGIAVELTGREVHPLRIDGGGSSPQVVRADDGAGAWRVSLQRDTPQARRLHYWQRYDGTIELSRVALHDDYTP
ncbi:MAG TPA: hypothetical protein VHG70_01225 [Nocardioidaceae bacterium]|nr:hypothetical protein [Nocardioidaceae bacterium]